MAEQKAIQTSFVQKIGPKMRICKIRSYMRFKVTLAKVHKISQLSKLQYFKTILVRERIF